jgi:hypothetical protein
MNYWLFTVMYDWFPTLWPTMVKRGLAAQHYPRGWTNEARNINALQRMKRGDGVIAALKGHRFAAYGFLKSDSYRGGSPLAIKHEDGTQLEFRERADIDWIALDPTSEVPYIDARHLKDRGFEIDLTRGLCVKQINRRTFEKVRQLLDTAGAMNASTVSEVQTGGRAVWLCFGDPERHLDQLKRASRRKRSAYWWTITKSARRGDRVVFYMIRPMSAFVAIGTADSDARLNEDRNSEWYGHYIAEVRDVEMLPGPVLLARVQDWFPEWDYLRTPRRSARVPVEIADELLVRLTGKSEGGFLVPCDDSEPPTRVATSVLRIIRDTAIARSLKRLYDWKCQVCGQRICCDVDSFYAEGHHLRPLGKHDGLDEPGNMLVLCPNHHAMFEFGLPRFLSPTSIQIGRQRLRLTSKHEVASENIEYYMKSIRGRNGQSSRNGS